MVFRPWNNNDRQDHFYEVQKERWDARYDPRSSLKLSRIIKLICACERWEGANPGADHTWVYRNIENLT